MSDATAWMIPPVPVKARKAIARLNGYQLAYQLSIGLYRLYDSGGLVERSLRYDLLSLFGELNEDMYLQTAGAFTYPLEIKERAQARIDSPIPSLFTGNCNNINNKRVKSVLILYMLREHYLEGVAENQKKQDEGECSINDIDYTFVSQLPDCELMFQVYRKEVGIEVMDLVTLARQYTWKDIYFMVHSKPKRAIK